MGVGVCTCRCAIRSCNGHVHATMQESPFYGLLGMIYDEDGGTVSRTHKKVGLLSIARRDVAALHEKEWTSRVSSLNGSVYFSLYSLVEGKRSLELGKLHNPHVWNRENSTIHPYSIPKVCSATKMI